MQSYKNNQYHRAVKYKNKKKQLETHYAMTKGSSSEKCSRISGVSSKSAKKKHTYGCKYRN